MLKAYSTGPTHTIVHSDRPLDDDELDRIDAFLGELGLALERQRGSGRMNLSALFGPAAETVLQDLKSKFNVGIRQIFDADDQNFSPAIREENDWLLHRNDYRRDRRNGAR